MKRIKFSEGGQSFNASDFKDIHDELFAAIDGQYNDFGAFVFSGCVVSGSQSNASISAGLVYIDRKVMRFPAQTNVNFTNNPTQYIRAAAAVDSRPKSFSLTSGQNTRTTYQAELATSSGAGQSLQIKFDKPASTLVYLLSIKAVPIGVIWETDDLTYFDLVTGLGFGPFLGWAFCDGRNNTPAANKRFSIGYDPSDADYNLLRKTGGKRSNTLTESNIPQHFFYIATDETVDDPLSSGSQRVAKSYDANGEFKTRLGASGANPTLGRTNTYGALVPTALDNRPEYIVLAKIKKIA
ncbi:MAG: hypothetical protein NW226_17455 [Microscillaceae bacterium]|nr:hypothetical protein [Microscillaceae bacterium]